MRVKRNNGLCSVWLVATFLLRWSIHPSMKVAVALNVGKTTSIQLVLTAPHPVSHIELTNYSFPPYRLDFL
jgi:hypothetical protein